LRLQTTDKVGSATYNRWLFNPTNGPSGRGLHWGELSDDNTSTAADQVPNIAITLGTGGHATAATLTRDVRYVASTDGANVNSRPSTPPASSSRPPLRSTIASAAKTIPSPSP